MSKNIIIGGAWPYANSSLHLGHLVALLPADFLARYHRKVGDNVIYVSGTDCHGTPITLRAKKEGKAPKEISDHYHEEFVKTFNAMNFSYDLYTQTEADFHKEKVQKFFRKMYDNGYIVEKEELQPYCEHDGKFLADRELLFTCPECGRESKGDGCDCGYMPTIEDFKKARCQECGNEVVLKNNRNLYITLPKLQPQVEKYYEENEKSWRKNAQKETLKYLKQGLIDRAVTRDLEWGIDIPVEGYENKKMYVWIDAVLGYLTTSIRYCEENGLNWEDYWKSEDSLVYMVHGKDNITFHTIILPALYFAMNDGIKPPHKIVSCEYLNINDEKISKSKGNGITILDMVEEFDVDSIRYYFINNGPENKDSNCSIDDFKKVHNSDLVNKFGNFINRTLKFKGLEKIELSELDEQVANKINETYKNVSTHIENLEFKKAIEEIMSLVEFGNKYYDDTKPWILANENEEEFKKVIYNCTVIIANLANLFEPVMPEISKKLKGYLNIDIDKWGTIKIDKEILLDDIEPLFERIK